MRIAVFLATLFLLAGNVLAQSDAQPGSAREFLERPTVEIDGWLCIADASTGFKYNGTSWTATNFTVDDSRYLIRRANTEQSTEYGATWVVVKLGTATILARTDQEYLDPYPLNFKGSGDAPLDDFRFSPNVLRFQYVWYSAYVLGLNNQTPFIEIGRCSPI